MNLALFLNILAWTFLILAVLRIILIFIWANSNDSAIRVAEMFGENPVGRALLWPGVIVIVCAAWLIAQRFA